MRGIVQRLRIRKIVQLRWDMRERSVPVVKEVRVVSHTDQVGAATTCARHNNASDASRSLVESCYSRLLTRTCAGIDKTCQKRTSMFPWVQQPVNIIQTVVVRTSKGLSCESENKLALRQLNV